VQIIVEDSLILIINKSTLEKLVPMSAMELKG
jgi:hypothetical protein